MPFIATKSKQFAAYGATDMVCGICGVVAMCAVGYKGSELTTSKKLECARLMGWRPVPRLICPRCLYRERTGL